mmetsp:Transcript_54914/g.133365  ORF Transcript_54914/g.133365 Transcript_54914/m.133365 type:complete len:451 (+) Transcript_54914:177-1529(+)
MVVVRSKRNHRRSHHDHQRRRHHHEHVPRRFFFIVCALTTGFAILGSCFSSAVADRTGSSSSSSSSSSTSSKPSIPRSVPRSNSGLSDPGVPPWMLSPNIDDDGFLREQYVRIPGEWEEGLRIRGRHIRLDNAPPAKIRQVPGDGNCLFHAISTCYAYAVNGTHIDLVGGRHSNNNSNNNHDKKSNSNSRNSNFKNVNDKQWLYQHSSKLRQLAVDQLEDRHRRKLLFLQGREYLRARDLVDSAASQYGLSGTEYCDLMRKDSYWGGGPEIVALCNALQRPIHVYELHVPENQQHQNQKKKLRRNKKRQSKKNKHAAQQTSLESLRRSSSSKQQQKQPSTAFVLRRMACFGSPKYDRHEPLHILSADSRFPDIDPGNHLPVGNHFLAIFPEPIQRSNNRRRDEEQEEEEEEDDDEISGGLLRGGYDDGSSSPGHRILWGLMDWWDRFWTL